MRWAGSDVHDERLPRVKRLVADHVRDLAVDPAGQLERAEGRPIEVRVDHPVTRHAVPFVGGLLQVQIAQRRIRRHDLHR